MGAHPYDYWDFWRAWIICASMVNGVKFLLDSFGLFEKIIAYVKNEGFNLSILTFTLIF
jgi:hypothetical protein